MCMNTLLVEPTLPSSAYLAKKRLATESNLSKSKHCCYEIRATLHDQACVYITRNVSPVFHQITKTVASDLDISINVTIKSVIDNRTLHT